MPESMNRTGTVGEFDAIYDYVRTIPAGRVVSYGQVGEAVGVEARTVGWAMSMAPEGVPWQRVVGADGYLRIAKRSPHLRDLQEALLKDEGVSLNEKGCVAREFFWGEDSGGDSPATAAQPPTLDL
jgi:methylated-DNA-protein-cysteine methyltransferase related protein